MGTRKNLDCQFTVERVPHRRTAAQVGLRSPFVRVTACRTGAVDFEVDGVKTTLSTGQRGLNGLIESGDPTDSWFIREVTCGGVILERDGVLGILLPPGGCFGGGEFPAVNEGALCISAFAPDLLGRVHVDREGLFHGSIATIQIVAVTLEMGIDGVPYNLLWVALDYVDLFPVRQGGFFEIFKPHPVHPGQRETMRVRVDKISLPSLHLRAGCTVTLSVDRGKKVFFVEFADRARRRMEVLASKHSRRGPRDGIGIKRSFKPGVCEDCRFPRRPMDAA